MERIDPTNIEQINERCRSWAEDPAAVRPVRIDRVVFAEDAIEETAAIAASLAGGGPVLLVMDDTKMTRRGDDLKNLISAAVARRAPTKSYRPIVPPGEKFHADLADAEKLVGPLSHSAVVISIGSGSITDVAKYARHLVQEREGRRVPFICFPTAASVTAYTSALAVLTVSGVKRTLASLAPDVVSCDLATLADAPLAMTLAGFGDVMARSVAGGDWYLAGELGMDDGFSIVPTRLLEPAETNMIAMAERVSRSELDGVQAVTEAILLAGMAMSVVAQTAPISGWEHVISHYLDMTAEGDGRTMALHGGQVGVATLIAGRAYERCWRVLDLDRLEGDLDMDTCRERIGAGFAAYDPSGDMVAEIRRDAEKKVTRWNANRKTRRRFIERKRAGELDGDFHRLVRPDSEIDDAMRRASAPRRFADLDAPIPARAALSAIKLGHLIRARFTLGDLLDVTGMLDEASARSYLDESDSI